MKDVKVSGAVNGPAKPHRITKSPRPQQPVGESCSHPTGKMSWKGEHMHDEHHKHYVK